MSNLADQILNRFPAGETIDRARLTVDANYDSVGRVLRQLVEDRKLVRVSRGRYRRAVGKRVISTATIADRIERQIDRSKRNVFLRADFAKLGSYDAVGRALRPVTEAGRLVQIGYGLYARSEEHTSELQSLMPHSSD